MSLLPRLLLLATFAFCSSVNAQSFVPAYGNATTTKNAQILQAIRESKSLDLMAASLSRGIQLPDRVTLAATECGVPNAFYNPQFKAIVLCLELVDYLRTGITRDFARVAKPEDREQIIAGAFAFILIHELGHTFIDLLKLPILGREEDAADQIGAYFLLLGDSAPNALAGALWFFRPKTSRYTQGHFADEHSLDPQRQINLACWAYGKDAQNYSYFVGSQYLPKTRAERCASEYSQLESSVRKLLEGKVQLPPSR